MAVLCWACEEGERVKPISPEEFRDKMKEIFADRNIECNHFDADNLMLNVLRTLGYGEGVDIFLNNDKWYS